MKSVLVTTMLGLGDAFAARPTVHVLTESYSDVFVETPWPEIFEDIEGVQFVKPADTTLRAQKRNVAKQPDARWVPRPRAKEIQLAYTVDGLKAGKSMPVQMANGAGVDWDPSLIFMVPSDSWYEGAPMPDAPYTVFRQPTLRTEYHNAARNPHPGYVREFVMDKCPRPAVHVNDLWEGERLIEERAPAEIEYLQGQLDLKKLLCLVANAAMVVSPVSWLAWAALAFKVKTLCVFGGYAPPALVFGPARVGLWGHLLCAAPAPFCSCFNPVHQCAKEMHP